MREATVLTRRLWIGAALACLALGAAAQPAGNASSPSGEPPLNSERIEQQFGSYGIEVLHSDASLRISNLYSTHGQERIGRTFAVTEYPRAIDPRIADAHAEIVAGGSIGAVFTRRGWTVSKDHRYYGEVEINSTLADLMRRAVGGGAAVHVYVLGVSRDEDTLTYATIAEVHHPDYLGLTDLPEIYGPPAAPRPGGDPLVQRMLEVLRRVIYAP